MKKLFVSFVLIAGLLVAIPPYFLGFSLFNLGHAVQVATSLSAKLACSARFISELDDQQIASDLSSYSQVTELVDLKYNDSPRQVSAHLFGLAPTVATYRDGLGCTLDFDGVNTLKNATVVQHSKISTEQWPAGISTDNIDPEIQTLLNSIMTADNQQGLDSRAMVVVRGGEILAEAYGDGFDHNTPLLGWSMGKSVTAMILGRLETLEKVSKDDIALFDQWTDKRADLSLEQLLQMNSGLAFDETYAPGSDATHMLFTAPSASDVAMTSKLRHSPGSHFSYSSGTTNLLSRYVDQILGSELNNTMAFVQQELFTPAGISNAIFEPDASGILIGSSYLYASGRDWARLGLIMANSGSINGHKLLSDAWVVAAQTPNASDNEKSYGYQFWLNRGDEELRWPTLPEDAYAMLGNRKQSVMIIPSQNTVLVRLGWTSDDYPMEENYKALLDALGNKTSS
ncbi:serine hydrolase domain-containing protein [Endozoicomonas elysicola]|uniref:Beta-lactamase n=1 Tax=Endozoicomonas elysicola TaxID=305900 RepID=A0A081KD11_9GAMM|nr:serine hydrolase [Endozoicomonas elysicola]KEI72037.1 beta-lactamase [Endozoicomonas elysicola]